jgi:hypothetical protein
MKPLMNPILYEALRRLRRWRFIGPVMRRLDRVPMAELPPDASWESSMGMAKGTEREILGYRSAMVDLASGVVIHHDKGVIGTQKMVNHQRQNFEATRLQLPASVVAMEGYVASMDWCWSTNYYHFLRDTLPMLYSSC